MSQLSIQTVGNKYHAMPEGKSLGAGEQAVQTVTDGQEQSKDSQGTELQTPLATRAAKGPAQPQSCLSWASPCPAPSLPVCARVGQQQHWKWERVGETQASLEGGQRLQTCRPAAVYHLALATKCSVTC